MSREVFERASAIIDRDGWCQGALVNRHGNVCGLGAVRRAQLELGNAGFFDREIEEAMHRFAFGYTSFTYWNDDVHRTVDEVQHALKLLAEEAS